MKVFESRCTFEYSWEEVSTANWRKYCPWNDKSTHVIATDTLSRTVDPETGIVSSPRLRRKKRTQLTATQLRTERLIACQQSAPKWVTAILGGNAVSYVYETSYVDPASKKVTMCSTNLTYSNVLSVRETVVYQPHQKSPESRTEFKQNAEIMALCGGWQKVKNGIEEFTVERFGQNAKKGREGFEAVLEMSRRVFGEQKEQQRIQQAA
jgi:PRELI-like family